MPYDNNWDEYAVAEDEAYEYGDSFEATRGATSSQSSVNRTIQRMQRQLNTLNRRLSALSRQTGTPTNIARRLHKVEKTTSQMQQNQLLTQLLDIPQLESIRFADEEVAKQVERSTYDKQSLLLMQLLGQNGPASGNGGNNDQLQSILPLLLLGKDGGGKDDDQLSTLLLFSMLNNNC